VKAANNTIVKAVVEKPPIVQFAMGFIVRIVCLKRAIYAKEMSVEIARNTTGELSYKYVMIALESVAIAMT